MHGRLAARKREVVRDELAEAALHLLAARGYEAVLVGYARCNDACS